MCSTSGRRVGEVHAAEVSETRCRLFDSRNKKNEYHPRSDELTTVHRHVTPVGKPSNRSDGGREDLRSSLLVAESIAAVLRARARGKTQKNLHYI